MNFISGIAHRVLNSINQGESFHFDHRDIAGLSGISNYEDIPARQHMERYLLNVEKSTRFIFLASGAIATITVFIMYGLVTLVLTLLAL